MTPSVVINRKQHKSHNVINAKNLNRSLVTNARLHKRIAVFTTQNKELSFALNNLKLHKLKMENEMNSIKNENIQLNAMNIAFRNRLNVLEQTLQKCVPALVTLSECIPSMMESVHEMSKFDKIIELKETENKTKQTRTVRSMVNGMTVIKQAVNGKRCNMPPIIESPRSEQSPRQTRKSSYRILPKCKLGVERYVRLKDVAVMFKNSKAVPNKNAGKRQQVHDVEGGLSWLHELQNSYNNNSAMENYENSPQVLKETTTPIRERTLTINEFQSDMSLATSISNANISNNMFNETEIDHISSTSLSESCMLRRITRRKPQIRRSSETSAVPSSIDVSSTSSTKFRRSAKKYINYQEPTLNTKLRRN